MGDGIIDGWYRVVQGLSNEKIDKNKTKQNKTKQNKTKYNCDIYQNKLHKIGKLN